MSEPTASAGELPVHTTTIEIPGSGQVNAGYEETEEPLPPPPPSSNGSLVHTPPPPRETHQSGDPYLPNGEPKSNGEAKTNGEAKQNGDVKQQVNGGVEPRTPGSEPAKELTEAVNFELVNMQPYTNSIPIKKEATELDIGDPYDEYFVPVNQHKKYMRGEKLYVTQDKRRGIGGSKKKCCWGLLTVFVLGAIVAILLGVILTSQDSDNLEDSRSFKGAKASIGGNLLPSQTTTKSPVRTTTEKLQIIVDNAIQGELTIDNLEFTPGLANQSSYEFKNLAASLEEELKSALFDHQTLHYGASDITVKVMEFRPGSVIVIYRIGWQFKEGIQNPPAPIDKDSLKSKLQEHIRSNDGFLYNYRLQLHTLKSEQILDKCQDNNGDCSQKCEFHHQSLEFTCTCEDSYVLDNDGKTCILSGTHESNEDSSSSNSSEESDESSENSQEKEDPKQEPPVTPEPEPSSSHAPTFNHEDLPETSPSSEPEPSPEPNAEPEPSPEPTAEPEPSPEPSAEPEASDVESSHELGLSHEPVLLPEPEPTAQPEPSPEPTALPEPSPEPTAQPEPSPEPTAQPEPSPEPTAQPEPSPEPAAQPEPSPEPATQPVPSPEPAAQPEPSPEPTGQPEPSPEPTVQPEPSPEPSAQPEQSALPESSASSEHVSESEPITEPEPLAKLSAHSEISSPEASTFSKPLAEPEPTVQPEPSPEPTAQPEPSASPDPPPSPEPSSSPESIAEPSALSEPSASTKHFSESESTAQPRLSPELLAQPEPSASPEHISETEPTAQQEPLALPELSAHSESSDSTESEHLSSPESYFELKPSSSSEKSSTEALHTTMLEHSREAEISASTGPSVVAEPIAYPEPTAVPEPSSSHESLPSVSRELSFGEMENTETSFSEGIEHSSPKQSPNSGDSVLEYSSNPSSESFMKSSDNSQMQFSLSPSEFGKEIHSVPESLTTESSTVPQSSAEQAISSTASSLLESAQLIEATNKNVENAKKPNDDEHLLIPSEQIQTSDLASSTEISPMAQTNSLQETTQPNLNQEYEGYRDSKDMSNPFSDNYSNGYLSEISNTAINASLDNLNKTNDNFLNENITSKLIQGGEGLNENWMISSMQTDQPSNYTDSIISNEPIITPQAESKPMDVTVPTIIEKNLGEGAKVKEFAEAITDTNVQVDSFNNSKQHTVVSSEPTTEIVLNSETTIANQQEMETMIEPKILLETTHIPELELTENSSNSSNEATNVNGVPEGNQTFSIYENVEGVIKPDHFEVTMHQNSTSNSHSQTMSDLDLTTMQPSLDSLVLNEHSIKDNKFNLSSTEVMKESSDISPHSTETVSENTNFGNDTLPTLKYDFENSSKPEMNGETSLNETNIESISVTSSSTENFHPEMILQGEEMPMISFSRIPDLSGPYSVDSTIQPAIEEDELKPSRSNEADDNFDNEDVPTDVGNSKQWYDSKNSLDDYYHDDSKNYYKTTKGKHYKSFKIEDVNIPNDSDAVEQNVSQITEKLPNLNQENVTLDSNGTQHEQNTQQPIDLPDHSSQVQEVTEEEKKLLEDNYESPAIESISASQNLEMKKNIGVDQTTPIVVVFNSSGIREVSNYNNDMAITTHTPEDLVALNTTKVVHSMMNVDASIDRNETDTSQENVEVTTHLVVMDNNSTTFEENINKTCSSDEIKCGDGKSCVNQKLKCNGISDCLDGSDEIGCDEECENKFKCKDGKCIDKALVCNSVMNCSDGSDEESCGSLTTNKTEETEDMSDLSTTTQGFV